MQQQYSFKLLPSEAADETSVKNILSQLSGFPKEKITGWHILKKSIDARSKTVWLNLTVNAFINESFYERQVQKFAFKDVRKADKTAVIIGAGPAGLFAALYLIEKG